MERDHYRDENGNWNLKRNHPTEQLQDSVDLIWLVICLIALMLFVLTGVSSCQLRGIRGELEKINTALEEPPIVEAPLDLWLPSDDPIDLGPSEEKPSEDGPSSKGS